VTFATRRFQRHVAHRSKFGVDVGTASDPESVKAARLARTYGGVVYHSKAEARYAAQLDLMVKAGKVVSWFRQVPLQLRCSSGALVSKYAVDFVVVYTSGQVVYTEVKGRWDPYSRLKFKWAQAEYPSFVFSVVGPDPRTRTPASRRAPSRARSS